MSQLRTTLVVSRHSARRRGWSRELAREGVRVVRCDVQTCPLLDGAGGCALLAEAQAAVYDEEAVGPQLFLALVRARERPTVLFAQDIESDGQHRPKFTRVLDHRGAATVFPHLR